MKIATITLNPAIDQTVFVDGFRIDTVNRGRTMQHDAGGKGVNVASFLADYGLSTSVTGLLGSDNAVVFERHFATKGIADRFVRVPGSTRIGVKIVDEIAQQTTDINMPGEEPAPGALDTLMDTIADLARDHEWFVLAGKLPPGVPNDFYATLIAELRGRGRQVALDASGPALTAGMLAGPTLAKPNLDELGQMLDTTLSDDGPTISRAIDDLRSRGVALAIVSMGAKGAIFSNGEATLRATPPSVPVKSTVGAGDAMVAGTIAALSEGRDLAGCARLATAFSLGAISSVGAHLPSRAALDAFADQVVVSDL